MLLKSFKSLNDEITHKLDTAIKNIEAYSQDNSGGNQTTDLLEILKVKNAQTALLLGNASLVQIQFLVKFIEREDLLELKCDPEESN